MADAKLTRVIPAVNKKVGGNKHFTFALEGENFQDDTIVTAKLGNLEWEEDEKHKHSATLLMIKLKRKPHKGKDEKTRQVEELIVTVHNPSQAMPYPEKKVMVGTYDL